MEARSAGKGFVLSNAFHAGGCDSHLAHLPVRENFQNLDCKPAALAMQSMALALRADLCWEQSGSRVSHWRDIGPASLGLQLYLVSICALPGGENQCVEFCCLYCCASQPRMSDAEAPRLPTSAIPRKRQSLQPTIRNPRGNPESRRRLTILNDRRAAFPLLR